MNDIRDVKPPLYLPDWGWLVWLLAAIAVCAAVYWWLGRRKSSRPGTPAPSSQLPSWEKAYQQLEDLRRENLPDKGLFKEFFTRVADIARHYMEDRFDIHAPQMSTEEFLSYLSRTGHLNESQKTALKEFLNSCDMVKFAKYAPTVAEALKNFDSAKRLVDDTRV